MSAIVAPPGFRETKLIDPFEIFVGPIFEKGEKGSKIFAFTVEERHTNLRGVTHGGMLMTFADLSLGAAVWDMTDNAPCVTMNMQTQFQRSSSIGDFVEVCPQITQRTRTVIFARGDFMVGGEIVMTASSVWKLL
jgi:acyl-coenzyme A thioesterase PaaI-like protein